MLLPAVAQRLRWLRDHLALTVVPVFLTPWAAVVPVTFHDEVEARYTALPVFLIEAASGSDARRGRGQALGI